jgi:predicted metal-binding membrane protein
MSGTITGLGQVGTHMPNTMGSLAFMVMWLGMMAAMMLPAVGPVVLAQRMVVRNRGEGAVTSPAFVASYLAVCLLMGVVPLLAAIGDLKVRSLPWRPALA